MPLQLVAGIYGMNFQYMPELETREGYEYFWIGSAVYLLIAVIVAWYLHCRLRKATRNEEAVLHELRDPFHALCAGGLYARCAAST